jgi:hypothetical protein
LEIFKMLNFKIKVLALAELALVGWFIATLGHKLRAVALAAGALTPSQISHFIAANPHLYDVGVIAALLLAVLAAAKLRMAHEFARAIAPGGTRESVLAGWRPGPRLLGVPPSSGRSPSIAESVKGSRCSPAAPWTFSAALISDDRR